MDLLLRYISEIKTPLILAGVIMIVLYSLFILIIRKGPKWSKADTPKIITLIINRIYILALIAIILGFLGFFIKDTERPVRHEKVIPGESPETQVNIAGEGWREYYVQACSLAEKSSYDKAIPYFKKALKQSFKDNRINQPDGTMVDYFPHRELGLVFLKTDNLEEAEKELKTSLLHYPSAKAKHYLDRVLKKLIEKETWKDALPELILDFKENKVRTREDEIVISGVAKDERYICDIMINGVSVILKYSAKSVPFKESVPLSKGENIIKIVAKNVLGHETECLVTIFFDREGPVIVIDQTTVNNEEDKKVVKLSGSIYDESGVVGLSINKRQVSIKEDIEVYFSKILIIDTRHLELTAHDTLGNKTSVKIPLSPISSSEIPIMLASLDLEGIVLSKSESSSPKDQSPPVIKLDFSSGFLTVYQENVIIQGSVKDDSLIVSLSINEDPILYGQGKGIYFTRSYMLEEGMNTFTIKAVDEHGNEAVKKIHFFRKIPKAFQLSERIRILIFPFSHNGTLSDLSFTFRNNLNNALIFRNRFNILDYDNLLEIITEHKNIGLKSKIDRGKVKELARLVGADYAITGNILQTSSGIEIVARMIESDTSIIFASLDVFSESSDPNQLKLLAERLSFLFNREFPILRGKILKQLGERILTDLGQNDGLRLGQNLIIYREGDEKEEHQLDYTIVGRARIIRVFPEYSKARFLDVKPDAIRITDKVVTE